MYLSRFFSDYNELSLEEQRQLILDRLNVNLFFVGDDASIDSTNSIVNEKVPHCYVMKVACSEWSTIYKEDMKEAWRQQAKKLNEQKLPGRFVLMPPEIEESLEDHIMDSLTYEWEMLVRAMKNCITCQPRNAMSSKAYRFGKEHVILQSQTYCELKLSYLLELTIFGNQFSKLKRSEIISKNKKIMLVHIASKKRIDLLFQKESSCATEFLIVKDGRENIFGCCGKVSILKNGRNILGYILEERNRKWNVLLSNNKMIWLDEPEFCSITNNYIFRSKRGMLVKKYWPI